MEPEIFSVMDALYAEIPFEDLRSREEEPETQAEVVALFKEVGYSVK